LHDLSSCAAVPACQVDALKMPYDPVWTEQEVQRWRDAIDATGAQDHFFFSNCHMGCMSKGDERRGGFKPCVMPCTPASSPLPHMGPKSEAIILCVFYCALFVCTSATAAMCVCTRRTALVKRERNKTKTNKSAVAISPSARLPLACTEIAQSACCFLCVRSPHLLSLATMLL
jgi:hypothetical protein